MSERMQNRPPTHPGAILREDVLPALGMTVTDAAKALDVSRQQVHRIMAETAPVTPEMALRLGKFCGNGPDLWLRMQASYDLWHARRDLEPEIERVQVGTKKAAALSLSRRTAHGYVTERQAATARGRVTAKASAKRRG